MKTFACTLLVTFLALHFAFPATLVAQPEPSHPAIIPNPQKLEMKEGAFTLDSRLHIAVAGASDEVKEIAEQLAGHLGALLGYKIPVNISTGGAKVEHAILLKIEDNLNALAPGGYTLDVTRTAATLAAPTPAGLFYAMHTLLQLLPPAVDGQTASSLSIPSLLIEDTPRFPWRGMHLDVCRHFFPIEFVKKYIDLLARYKLNTFHWHLTEDQGWRIEIKKYPKLTEVGAWRKETMGDGAPYGGFYTQEEIRDVVAYARERFITIVPEIEMPGHALAALASYPEYSCTGGPFSVGTTWGVFEDVYCAGNDKTFAFLEDILTEVTALFPGEVIHIGGDECPKERWKTCAKCQARITTENLKDEHELQSYFITRIEKFLNGKGKRIIGWDEILEGGLAPNASVMSWRGTTGGIEAAKARHDVVMSPGAPCYFDHYQGISGEPKAFGGFNPIERVYAYEPVPAELTPEEARHILGAQGNLWTEHIADARHAEYMLMPRMLALSEVVWSQPARRDSADFFRRLEQHYDRLAALDVNFRVPPPKGIGSRIIAFGDTSITLRPPLPRAQVHYALGALDSPAEPALVYNAPLPITGAASLSARTILPNGRSSRTISSAIYRIDPEANGLHYEYFEGEWALVPDFTTLAAAGSGMLYDIGLDGIPRRSDHFAVRLSSSLLIEREGEYTFFLTSDDGSKLFIDDREVINSDGAHGVLEKSGSVALSAGTHTLRIEYLEISGSELLDLAIAGPGIPKQHLPPQFLYK